MANCLECNQVTDNPKFCNSSCAAKFNNKNRKDKCPGRNQEKQASCKSCGSIIQINLRANSANAKCEICRNRCKYCGNQSKFKLENGTFCCSVNYQQCPEIKSKNISGVRKAHKEGRLPGWRNLDAAGKLNRKWACGSTAYTDSRIQSKYDPELLFSNEYDCPGPRKRILIDERGHKCEECGFSEWMNLPITLELDHVNGDKFDNRKDNLKLLCPNCHSLTPTWRRRTDGKNRLKYDIAVYIDTISSSSNMNQCLNKLGLSWGCSRTINGIMKRYNIGFLDQ